MAGLSDDDHYAVLGISPDADAETVRHAYRERAFAWHPDHRPDDPEAAAMFRRIQEAYEVLSDPQRRRDHDAARMAGEAGGAPSDEEGDLWDDDWGDAASSGGPASGGGRIPEAADPRDAGVPQAGRPGFWPDDEVPQSGRPGFWER